MMNSTPEKIATHTVVTSGKNSSRISERNPGATTCVKTIGGVKAVSRTSEARANILCMI